MEVCKTLRKIFAVSMVFSCTFAFSVLANSAGKVTGDNVNVRDTSSTSGDILGKVNEGDRLELLSIEGSFYQVGYNGNNNAYVTSEFIQVVTAVGRVNDSGVNIRSNPSTSADVLGKVNTGETVVANGITGEWYQIEYSGNTAYIHKDFVTGSFLGQLPTVSASSVEAPQPVVDKPAAQSTAIEATTMTYTPPANAILDMHVVTVGSGLRLRSEPSLDASIVTTLSSGFSMDVVAKHGEWYEVNMSGLTGFVNAEFVDLRDGKAPENNSTKAQAIIDYGKQFLGTPYVYAGTDLRNGVDCSGFVYAVMRDNGISLSRSSRTMVNDGVKISKDQLQMGDLVFFDTNGGANNGNISHVGIYISDGQFIHSSSSKRTWGICISSLYEDYYIRTYVTACRVLN